MKINKNIFKIIEAIDLMAVFLDIIWFSIFSNWIYILKIIIKYFIIYSIIYLIMNLGTN